MKRIEKRLLEIARRHHEGDDYYNGSRAFHVSFLTKRNKILAKGINRGDYTHSWSKHFGTFTETVHAEMSAILSYIRKYGVDRDRLLRDITLYNIRIDRNHNIRMAKPCAACSAMIASIEIGNVYYTCTDNTDNTDVLFKEYNPSNFSNVKIRTPWIGRSI